MKTAVLFCLAILVAGTGAHGFDYASYKPADLDEILALPKPQSGVDVSEFQKFAFTVSLEAYAEKCNAAGVLKLVMTMLPTVYPKPFAEALSESKCIKVKSAKGASLQVATQDKVAEFLPAEVPLGSNVKVYCLLMCMTADGPGLLVTEFEAHAAPKE